MPYVSVNRHRGGFQPPPLSEYGLEEMANLARIIRSSIREAFGLVGVHAWDDLNPDFEAELTATLLEVRAQGAWDQHVNESCARGDEAWQRTGAMLTALLHAREDEPPKDLMLRALAAHAGVDEESVHQMLQRDESEAQ